jgi:hypothetical protein
MTLVIQDPTQKQPPTDNSYTVLRNVVSTKQHYMVYRTELLTALVKQKKQTYAQIKMTIIYVYRMSKAIYMHIKPHIFQSTDYPHLLCVLCWF